MEKLKSIGQRISPEALATMKANLARTNALKQIAVEKGLKEYDVDLDTGSRRYDLRVTAIK